MSRCVRVYVSHARHQSAHRTPCPLPSTPSRWDGVGVPVSSIRYMCTMQQRQQLRRPGHTRRRREAIKGLTVGRPLRRRGETPRKTALGERQRGGAQLEGRGGCWQRGEGSAHR